MIKEKIINILKTLNTWIIIKELANIVYDTYFFLEEDKEKKIKSIISNIKLNFIKKTIQDIYTQPNGRSYEIRYIDKISKLHEDQMNEITSKYSPYETDPKTGMYYRIENYAFLQVEFYVDEIENNKFEKYLAISNEFEIYNLKLLNKQDYAFLKAFTSIGSPHPQSIYKLYTLDELNEILNLFLICYKKSDFITAFSKAIDKEISERTINILKDIYFIKDSYFRSKGLYFYKESQKEYSRYIEKIKKKDIDIIKEKFDSGVVTIKELADEYPSFINRIRRILLCEIYEYPESKCFKNIENLNIYSVKPERNKPYISLKEPSIRIKISEKEIFEMRNDFFSGQCTIKELILKYGMHDYYNILSGRLYIKCGGHVSAKFFEHREKKGEYNIGNFKVRKYKDKDFLKLPEDAPQKGFLGSLGEKRIFEYLEKKSCENNYLREYPIVIDGSTHYFDFFNQKDKKIIEFDGKQHYEAVSLFGGEKQLKLQQERDIIKNNWCQKNNYQLLRVRYDEQNIDSILNEFLSN